MITERGKRIPEELRSRAQWVIWRYGNNGRGKVPLSAETGKPVNAHAPDHWSGYDDARAAEVLYRAAGVGFVFDASDPYVGIDLDNCMGDDGQPNGFAQAVLSAADSYAERSPSGRGIKIIVRGSTGGRRVHTAEFEVYGERQYFTLTGDVLYDAPIREAQGVVDMLLDGAGTGAATTPMVIPTYSPLDTNPGGPLRTADGSFRRLGQDHWLSCYMRGDEEEYQKLAAKYHWDKSLSGVRWHGAASLRYYGYPDEEIATIMRDLFPEDQGRSEHWWHGEIWRCLYKEGGAIDSYPDVVVRPTTYRCGSAGKAQAQPQPQRRSLPDARATKLNASGDGADETQPEPRKPQRGAPRPKAITPEALLRWYHEQQGKRPLNRSRHLDAEELGIAIRTLLKYDKELERSGLIKIRRHGQYGREIIIVSGPFEDYKDGKTRLRGRSVPTRKTVICAPNAIGVPQGGVGGGRVSAPAETLDALAIPCPRSGNSAEPVCAGGALPPLTGGRNAAGRRSVGRSRRAAPKDTPPPVPMADTPSQPPLPPAPSARLPEWLRDLALRNGHRCGMLGVSSFPHGLPTPTPTPLPSSPPPASVSG